METILTNEKDIGDVILYKVKKSINRRGEK